jgi:hypothetical protein
MIAVTTLEEEDNESSFPTWVDVQHALLHFHSMVLIGGRFFAETN